MRRIVKKILMMGFIVCMFMVFGFLSTASAVPYSVTQMSNNDRDDYNVRISNNGDMVWVGPGAGGNSAIYVYDATINLTRLLTSDSYYSEYPQINANGDIVWREFSPVELDYNIMLYTKATNTIKRISLPKDPNFPHYDTNPQINNLGQVVYQSQNNGSDYEIMFYDGAMVTQVTDNDLIDEFPMLNDSGDIVWMASVVNTGTSDIYLYDGGSKAITRITDTTANHIIPRINNAGDIVFSGWDGAHYEIYYYKRSMGTTAKVTNSTCDNIMVQINASGQIAWVQVCAAGAKVIFRSGLTGININISNSPTSDDFGPQINDNGWVTWYEDQGNTGTNDQIFVWDGTTVTRLTNDANDNINPVINNYNTIAWQGTTGPGTDYEIFRAITGPCAILNCNDNNLCTTDSCDMATGTCVHAPIKCDDYNECTIDTCNPAVGCVHTPINCSDNNTCTTDTCDPATGACVHTTIANCCKTAADCNDNNVCTTDMCVNNACVHTLINDGFCCPCDPSSGFCDPAHGCPVYLYCGSPCNDNNACTIDICSLTVGCVYTPINCDDNNACTTDSCDPATGCVHTPIGCNDNNACTEDICNAATGACSHTSITCIGGVVCDPATGCTVTSLGNNFTLLASNGYTMGGTNDIKFTWDGTIQSAATFSHGTGPSNATISSDEPLDSWLWYARRVQVVGPGTYWVGLGNGGPSVNHYEVTIPTGQIGAHMLMDWGPTGQATSCGKTNCNIDVWVAWQLGGAFATGKLFTGADNGTDYNQPLDGTTSLLDGRPNAGTKVCDLVSVDIAGRIVNSTGTTITNLPLDGVPGIKLMQGDYYGSNVNFNLMLEDPCADAATRCNDNNACTNDLCDQVTGACSHTTVVCDDGNLCTVDTCNTVTGCVFAPKNSNDNNPCTDDYCNMQGNIIHPAHNCDDNNVCTTDTCNTATGCVHTNNTVACTDNNACTSNDLCSGGVCVPGAPIICTDGSACTPALGCKPGSVSKSGNNMTILMPTGLIYGGTNDVKFTWDGTIQSAATFANGTGPSNNHQLRRAPRWLAVVCQTRPDRRPGDLLGAPPRQRLPV